MSKLFLALPVRVDAAIHALVKDLVGEPQTRPHLTLMYCGTKISDEDAETIALLWKGALVGQFKDVPKVTLLPEFSLFGKEHDVLVLKCKVDAALEDAVNTARAVTARCVQAVPPPDFHFEPHVTLGFGSHALPDVPADLGGLGEQEAQNIVLYGDDYSVRGAIQWSDLIQNE